MCVLFFSLPAHTHTPTFKQVNIIPFKVIAPRSCWNSLTWNPLQLVVLYNTRQVFHSAWLFAFYDTGNFFFSSLWKRCIEWMKVCTVLLIHIRLSERHYISLHNKDWILSRTLKEPTAFSFIYKFMLNDLFHEKRPPIMFLFTVASVEHTKKYIYVISHSPLFHWATETKRMITGLGIYIII